MCKTFCGICQCIIGVVFLKGKYNYIIIHYAQARPETNLNVLNHSQHVCQLVLQLIMDVVCNFSVIMSALDPFSKFRYYLMNFILLYYSSFLMKTNRYEIEILLRKMRFLNKTSMFSQEEKFVGTAVSQLLAGRQILTATKGTESISLWSILLNSVEKFKL